MDLAGIEPASESLSIKASPITVIILTFPHCRLMTGCRLFGQLHKVFHLLKALETKCPASVEAGNPDGGQSGADCCRN